MVWQAIVRAAGSGMMRSGSLRTGLGQAAKKAGSADLGELVKLGKDGINKLGGISNATTGLLRIVKRIEKASPALKQQMVIFGKSISLILRPIGDIMAKIAFGEERQIKNMPHHIVISPK